MPAVISGETFRREILGLSKQKFYALVKSGRLRHLVSTNLSTTRRTYYVRAAAEAWAEQRAPFALRARQHGRVSA